MWIGLALLGCSTGSDGRVDADPRCEVICAIREPPLDGAGDICSADSAEQCRAECDIRIDDLSSLCATCLLEYACFAPSCSGEVPPGEDCSETVCVVRGRAGECSYNRGDAAARDACVRQVNPRREVDCRAQYRAVNDCAALCTDEAPPDDDEGGGIPPR
jgi:hypothetical protein